MRDHSQHIQLSREEALQKMLAGLNEINWETAKSEHVSIYDACGRVLASDALAQNDMPSALTCAMDSVAVHWSAFEGLAADELPDTSTWVRGNDWQFANTGVAMPEGFDTAIVIEHVQVSPDEQSITIDAAPSKQCAGTRPVGSTHKCGDVLASAGTLITPDIAARIASGNNASVVVACKPRVAFIPTGNELVPPGIPFDASRPETFAARGRNFETNSILVAAKVAAWGGQFVPFDIVCDEPLAIRNALERACALADIVVLNAGSSKGSDDWSCEVMDEMGTMICHQTNHGPGHHSSYAIINNTPIVGISGPSGGASFTLDFYLRPLMRAFVGLEPQLPKIPARLAQAFPAPPHGPHGGKPAQHAPAGEVRPREMHSATGGAPGFFSIRPLVVRPADNGMLEAYPVAGRPGSAEARAANAYAMIAAGPDIAEPAVGDTILVELK